MRSEREGAGGEAAGAIGESFAGVALIGQRGGGVKGAAARIATKWINVHAPGEAARFAHADFDARGAIKMPAQIAP